MLWLALAVIWLVGAIGRKRFTLRFGPVDAAVLVLVAWQCIAALHAVRYGSPRPALNMLWEWVGLGMVFFLARQLIHDAREVRAVVAAMIALMAAISVYGIYQCAIELPALQRQFAADPEGHAARGRLELSARHAAPRSVREAAGESRAAGHVRPDEFAGRGLGAVARGGTGARAGNAGATGGDGSPG